MATIRITRIFNFDMAHALPGYDGKCKNIHGHTYQLEVTVKGETLPENSTPKNGMLIDFSVLKNLINKELDERWDHALILKKDENNQLHHELKKQFERVFFVDYSPTTENLLCDFAKRISAILPENISLFSLKLMETPKSFAEWYASEN